MEECSLVGAALGGAVPRYLNGVDFCINTSISSAAPMVNTEQVEGVFVVDVDGPLFREPKKKIHASTLRVPQVQSFHSFIILRLPGRHCLL